MTEIKYEKGAEFLSISAKGHAEYGPKDSDIVCSAVSILMFTLAEAVESSGVSKCICLDEGNAKIIADISTNGGTLKTAYETIMGGFRLLANKHPSHVSIV